MISSTPNNSFRSLAGKSIKQVEDFKYLGSFVMNSEKDMKSRKALAWVACNKLNKIWHSTPRPIKRKFTSLKRLSSLFSSTEQKHGHLTTCQQKRLDGAYTNMLRRVQNIHWSGACHPRAHIWEISRLCHKRSSSRGYRSPDTATEPQRKWYIMYYCGGLVAMSVTEASHTQIPS